MVKWKLVYTKQAQRDSKKLLKTGLKPRTIDILEIIKQNPFQSPPPFEKLVGDLSGTYSRRINIQHRLVYQVIEKSHIVKLIRMWTYYE